MQRSVVSPMVTNEGHTSKKRKASWHAVGNASLPKHRTKAKYRTNLKLIGGIRYNLCETIHLAKVIFLINNKDIINMT